MLKRRPISLLSLTLAITLLLSTFASVAAAAESDGQAPQAAAASSMQSYVEAMQPGWNLGNSLDAVGADETAWGNPRITQALIQQIAAQGYKSIRIPVTWDKHIGAAPNYTVESAYMNRVEEVVRWALDANLYVMINVHHDSWTWVSSMEPKHDEVLARYNALWTQIAQRFKDQPNKLMFESINEPRFSEGGTTDEAKMNQMLQELNVSFHKIVRASGGKNATRPLVLPGLDTSPAQAKINELYNTITKLNDPNLIATVHYYGFWPFSVNIAGYTTFEKDTKNDIVQTFDNVYNTFVAKGIPVIVGEYGLLGFDKNTGVIEQGEKLKFFEFLTYYMKEKKVTGVLWDNGQHLNRTTYKWSDPELFNVIKSSLKGRSSNAASDLIHLKKGTPAQDVKVILNLNGNQLKILSVGGKQLTQGTDYALSGDTLTLKASLLTSLTTSGKYGENAVITAKFNKGADWNFKVVVYDTPKLSAIDGTTQAFTIPTEFRGSQLATMEAVYTNGGNAGSQDWTPYKEFGNTFAPAYDANGIKLLPEFFNSVKDGEVTLKFHFWSGDVVTYKITKSGTRVTGTTS
ncbi:Endoglucanase D [Paenibacillus polymyxa E681]|uniref:cellulase family glycosylhydrolase n=1 Tax=Paenibacillus polymyxa TaxID=1406 RepID=UPI0001E32262|nr:cellulase family glycosylhydrolase [Paenibacillus polymyxa]ADM72668.1 cellulase [Paenibacillus polymyxa E681]QNV59695.1 Endoglucanase D [Paenibacillus polymyxa E681]QNV64521.1 Endoglucanase D [Paenibacillus polymyxa E681]